MSPTVSAFPRMSVVMPVYNVEAYIAEAIQSVLDQSLFDFELIIVDDGGSDNSIAIARSFLRARHEVDAAILTTAAAERALAHALVDAVAELEAAR